MSLQMVIANTLFRTVCYHPDIYQIVTSGTDRKVCFVTTVNTFYPNHYIQLLWSHTPAHVQTLACFWFILRVH